MSNDQTSPGKDTAAIIGEVLKSSKYRDVDPEVVRYIAGMEAPKEKRMVDAVDRIKRKLHQTIGAFVRESPTPARWLDAISAAKDESERRTICARILSQHSSTYERLPELEAIYEVIFSDVRPNARIADLACGLNPIGRPFMKLPDDAWYFAADAHSGLVGFVGSFMRTCNYPGEATTINLLDKPQIADFDLVLLLKTLPCLEQVRAGIGPELLKSIKAPQIIVSYPTKSLGGHKAGMATFYRDRFRNVMPPEFEVEEFQFRSELVFKLKRKTGAS